MKKRFLVLVALAFLGVGCSHPLYKKEKTQNAPVKDASIADIKQMDPLSDEDVARVQRGVADSYLSSKFRVLQVVRNWHDSSFVVLATERDKNTNDTGCGSVYTAPTCYFFIEPDYVAGAPETHLAAKLVRSGGIYFNTPLEFVDAERLRFQTREGDAGSAIERTWEVNLKTGTSTVIDTKTLDLGN